MRLGRTPELGGGEAGSGAPVAGKARHWAPSHHQPRSGETWRQVVESHHQFPSGESCAEEVIYGISRRLQAWRATLAGEREIRSIIASDHVDQAGGSGSQGKSRHRPTWVRGDRQLTRMGSGNVSSYSQA